MNKVVTNLALTAALPVALVLAACGGGSEPAATTTPVAEPALAPAPVEADPVPAADTTPTTTGEQTLKEALVVFCEAPSKSGAADATPEQKATAMATWIQANATNREFLELMSDMGSVAPADRAARMEAVLAAEGITDCEMMTVMNETNAKATPTP